MEYTEHTLDSLSEAELGLWDRIRSDGGSLDSPFLSPVFVTAVAAVRPQTRVAVVSDRETGIIGFVPYERHAAGRATAVATGLSDVQGFVMAAQSRLDIAALMRACRIRVFEFDHLLAEQESHLERSPRRVRTTESPVMHMPDGYAAYLVAQQSTSKSIVQTTARKRRKLEREHGPVTLEFESRDPHVLDQVLDWKSDQYRRTGRRDRFAEDANRRLVSSLLKSRDPGGAGCLSVLRAGDSVVAAHFGLRSRQTLAWWFPVYNPDFAAYSPGLILCLAIAEDMGPEGLTTLDLGKGDESYKSRLANTHVSLLEGAVARSKLPLALYTARTWPREKTMEVVIGDPRLRSAARQSLALVGSWRQRITGSNAP